MRLHLRKQEAADLIGSLAEEGEFDAVLSHWHAKSLNLKGCSKVLHTMPSGPGRGAPTQARKGPGRPG